MSPAELELLGELDEILREAPEIAGDLGSELNEILAAHRSERTTERPGSKEGT